MDKTNINVVGCIWENKLKDFYQDILNDIFQKKFDISYNKVHVYKSGTEIDHKYFIITLPYDPESEFERIFLTLNKDQNNFDLSKHILLKIILIYLL